MVETTRRYVLANRPDGRPGRDAFDLREVVVGDARHGEVTVRTLYLSVDPYMRGRMRDSDSYADPWGVGDPLRGHVVGEVVDSRHRRWEAGDLVTGRLLWSEYAVADGDDLSAVDPSGENVSLPAYLGVLGMPGRTAYFGTLDVAAPDPGETVVVSGAAGAVGSTAGQIAALCGARVVGIAGTGEKVDYLEDDLGFDAAVNYDATDDLGQDLAAAAPDGVDAYFDNVGGPVTDAVFPLLNVGARVAVCGQIALYNREDVPTGPRKLPGLVATRARVEGFLVRDYAARFERATERLRSWVVSGDLDHRETVVDGFENAPEAFLGLFEGANVGKQVVAVGDPTDAGPTRE